MGSNGDIYQVVLQGTLMSQQCDNVFFLHLQKSGALFGSAATLATLIDQQWFAVGNIFETSTFVDDMVWFGTKITNLFDDSDYIDYVYNTPKTGTSTLDPMPPYVAYSLRSEWLGPGMRRVFKRFGGVPENYGTQGVITSGTLTTLDTLGADLIVPLTSSGGGSVSTWEMVQVKRVKETDPITGKVTYRLPATQLEAEFAFITSLVPQVNLSTQNTRKYNAGG